MDDRKVLAPHERDPAGVVGARLREAREARGMSLEDVAQVTKVTRTTLAALESGDPTKLPAPVYARGFLRAYATVVGLDGRALIRELDASQAERDDRRPMARRDRRAVRVKAATDLSTMMGARDTPRPALRVPHLLLLLVATGMFLTAWFTVGVTERPTIAAAPAPPAIQERVDGVSTYTSADSPRD